MISNLAKPLEFTKNPTETEPRDIELEAKILS